MPLHVLFTQPYSPGPVIAMSGIVESQTLAASGTSTADCPWGAGGIVLCTAITDPAYVDVGPAASVDSSADPRAYIPAGTTLAIHTNSGDVVDYTSA